MLSLSLFIAPVLADNTLMLEPRDWRYNIMNTRLLEEVITRDVCVIGGGSSGIHAAVSLNDLNKTVAVVEQSGRLGGHTATYIDPKTQTPIDFGVIIHQPLKELTGFFERFGIPLLNMSSGHWNRPGEPANQSLPSVGYSTFRKDVDFRNGAVVDRPVVDPAESLARMAEIISRFPYILHGYTLPDPVPEELYISFGTFLERHNVTDVISVYYQFSQGMGDLLHLPTIYAIKYFNLGDLQALKTGYFTAATGNTAELYSRAGDYIGLQNIFLQSTVVAANRVVGTTVTGRPELIISGPGTGLKLLSCSQILLTIPPTMSNIGGWDLSEAERTTFSRFTLANGYWTGLVTSVGLNESVTYWNAAATTPFKTPVLPALYALTPTGLLDDVWAVKFGANTPDLTDAQVQQMIQDEIRTLQHAFGSREASDTEDDKVKFLSFASHSPFMLQVTPEEIGHGFYTDLSSLQGGFGGTMFYSGATFHTHYTALLWHFNKEVVIPMMLR
ncbi:hypothetical protein DL769_001332 [Monosporascus sp. CRB-8-3]|nr:hypothetical protein DL769_001332 [Monosporascus sp. CRB-8-3]